MKYLLTLFTFCIINVQVNAQEFTIRNIPSILQSTDILVDELNGQFWITNVDEADWEHGVQLYDYQGLKLESYFPGVDSIFRIERDAHNNLWCMGIGGIAVKDGNGWQYLYQGLFNWEGGGLNRIGNDMWVSYAGHTLKISETDTIEYSQGLDASIEIFESTTDGTIWGATSSGKIYSFTGSAWELDTAFNINMGSWYGGGDFHADVNNTLWVVLGGELYSRPQHESHFTKINVPLPELAVMSIASDNNGTIYLGTSKGVLIKNGNTWSGVDSSNGIIGDWLPIIEVDRLRGVILTYFRDWSNFWGPGVSLILNDDTFANTAPLTGIVYNDINNSGVKDDDEAGLEGHLLNLNDGTYLITGSDGKFVGLPEEGSNTLSWVHKNYFEAGVTPTSFEFTYTDGDTLYFEIGLNLNEVTDISTSLSGNATRPGFNTTLYVGYKNEGSVSSDATLSLTYDPSLTYIESSVDPAAQVDNKLEWNLTNLKPQERGYISVVLNIPPTLPLGTILTSRSSFQELAGETDQTNNVDTLTQTITGSFDPNDKLVEEGVQEARYRKIDLDLTYTIRFQNTGTDTAFFVRVVDTLDVNLAVTTFELLAASHEIDFSLNDRILTFTFHDILLPDSTRDEPNSHGFIKYRIRNNAGIPNNTIVRNSAAIYFDFNLPIYTNEVSNVYVENLPQIITDYDEGTTKPMVDMYPNPAEKFIIVKAGSGYNYAELLNSVGVPIKNLTILNEERISLDELTKGIYFIVLSNGRGKSVHKIVVR